MNSDMGSTSAVADPKMENTSRSGCCCCSNCSSSSSGGGGGGWWWLKVKKIKGTKWYSGTSPAIWDQTLLPAT